MDFQSLSWLGVSFVVGLLLLGLFELLKYLWRRQREMETRERVALYALVFGALILGAVGAQTLFYKYVWTYDNMMVAGDFYFSYDDYEGALKSYSQAALINGTSWEAFYRKGVALSHLERFDEAEGAFNRAMTLEENEYTLSAWGYVLAQKGRHREAITYYDRALAINPAFEYALTNRQRAVEGKPPL
jgi:tetratricopeptide (TPR) repeat protein